MPSSAMCMHCIAVLFTAQSGDEEIFGLPLKHGRRLGGDR